MGLLDLFKRKKVTRIGGAIGYFGLESWWLDELSDDERDLIESTFKPLGESDGSLTKGDISISSQSAVGFLSTLSGWFDKPGQRHVARKILSKAEELLAETGNILSQHFFYQQKIEVLYRERDQSSDGLGRALEACWQQIDIAEDAAAAFRKQDKGELIVSHVGFTQLAIVLEKQKNYPEAVRVCERAQSQGWNGDWGHRIKRCQRKQVKLEAAR